MTSFFLTLWLILIFHIYLLINTKKEKEKMSRKKKLATILLFCFFTNIIHLYSCSEIYFNDEQFIVARTLDFPYGDTDISVYPRGINRSSYFFNKTQKPLQWTSKYGSVSFDLQLKNGKKYKPKYNGCVFGLNEKGLTAGVFFLNETEYQKIDSREVLDSASWAQYVLDNYKSVKALIEDSKSNKFQMIFAYDSVSGKLPLKLTAHDFNGDSVIFEYIKGKLIITENPEFHVISNTVYKDDVEALKKCVGFGGNKEIPGDTNSTSRFIRGVYNLNSLVECLKNNPNRSLVNKTNPKKAVAYGFDIIQTITQPLGSNPLEWGNTQWTLVTDITNKKIYFRTYNNADISYLDFKDLNFSKNETIKQYNFFNDLNRPSNIIGKLVK